MRFLRSIQLDASDLQRFEHAAQPGEWAVPGSFALLDIDPLTCSAKLREAFLHGFVGIQSFGHVSLVTVADIGPAALADVIETIAAQLRRQCGAPSDNAARRASVTPLCACGRWRTKHPGNCPRSTGRFREVRGRVHVNVRRRLVGTVSHRAVRPQHRLRASARNSRQGVAALQTPIRGTGNTGDLFISDCVCASMAFHSPVCVSYACSQQNVAENGRFFGRDRPGGGCTGVAPSKRT